ncbi:MAG: hypothetical protein IJ738_05350 [Alphaproteobacteria bacterium]|nr:hypothetical protein [Alphaproteobacteria bacterium]
MKKQEMNEDRIFRPRRQVFKAKLTQGGHIAMWERGGMHKSIGKATLIATPKGNKTVALMVKLDDEPNGRHALVQVHKGFIIAYGTVKYGTESICLYVVSKVRTQKRLVEAQLINEFYHGLWLRPLEERFEKIEAAMHQILATRDCVEPVFVTIPPERLEAIEIYKQKRANATPL